MSSMDWFEGGSSGKSVQALRPPIVKLYEDLMSHLHVSWVMCMYVMITNDYDDSYENGTQTRKSLLVCQDPLDW